jgi:hypothetical protein
MSSHGGGGLSELDSLRDRISQLTTAASNPSVAPAPAVDPAVRVKNRLGWLICKW